MHTLFQICNLSVRVQDKTLLEIDQLDIPSGMTVIIGPNGAGKSTLLRALIGQTGQGEITLFGEAVAPQIRAGRVAWVGQHGRYNMPMTVREYIALASFVQKGRLNHEWADELLDYFDLTALADKRSASSQAVNSNAPTSSAPCCKTRRSCFWTNRATISISATNTA